MKLAGLYRAVAEVFDGPLDIERHARKALLETADRAFYTVRTRHCRMFS